MSQQDQLLRTVYNRIEGWDLRELSEFSAERRQELLNSVLLLANELDFARQDLAGLYEIEQTIGEPVAAVEERLDALEEGVTLSRRILRTLRDLGV